MREEESTRKNAKRHTAHQLSQAGANVYIYKKEKQIIESGGTWETKKEKKRKTAMHPVGPAKTPVSVVQEEGGMPQKAGEASAAGLIKHGRNREYNLQSSPATQAITLSCSGCWGGALATPPRAYYTPNAQSTSRRDTHKSVAARYSFLLLRLPNKLYRNGRQWTAEARWIDCARDNERSGTK